METLPIQAHCGRRPTEADFRPVVGNRPAWGKPDGGFWTSTYETLLEDGWVGWCRAEEYGGDFHEAWLLKPRAARVYVVDGEAAVMDFCERFGIRDEISEKYHGAPYYSGVNWLDVMKEYDAVRLTAPYAEGVRWNRRASVFYGWDCESTVWLRWSFEPDVKKVLLPHKENKE